MQAARAATQRIPIIMAAGSSDPIAEGYIASFARPGGNITGLTYAVSSERFQKQLEILKEALPLLSRVGVWWDSDADLYRRSWAPALDEAARQLGLEVEGPFLVRKPDDFEPAFAAMVQRQIKPPSSPAAASPMRTGIKPPEPPFNTGSRSWRRLETR